MSLSIIPDVNDARLVGLRDYLDSGSGHAKLQLYGGARPSLPTSAAGSPMLAEITLSLPCGTVSAHTLSLSSTTLAQIINSGICTWARLVRAGDTTGIDGDATDVAGAGDFKLSDTTLWAGAFVTLTYANLV